MANKNLFKVIMILEDIIIEAFKSIIDFDHWDSLFELYSFRLNSNHIFILLDLDNGNSEDSLLNNLLNSLVKLRIISIELNRLVVVSTE